MKTRKVALVGVAALTLAVIAAACGGDGSHGDSPVNVDPTAVPTIAVAEQTTAPEDTPSPVDTEVAQAPTQEPTSGEPSDPVVEPDDGAEEIAVADVPSAADDLAALEWTSEDVDLGIKPAISLLPDGTPMIAYMTEDAMGFVRAAVRTAEGFEITTVAEGYYYGPLDLAIGNDGAAHIAWHDQTTRRWGSTRTRAMPLMPCFVTEAGPWKLPRTWAMTAGTTELPPMPTAGRI